MVSEQDLEHLDTGGPLRIELVCIQCTKSPDVAARTIEVLDELKHKAQANVLRGR